MVSKNICNKKARQYYRIHSEVIAKIGFERCQALPNKREASNKLSMPELQNFIKHYKQKIKEL